MADLEQMTNLERDVEEVVQQLLVKGDEFVQLLKDRLQDVAPKRRRVRSQNRGRRII
jgi:hypothetical protein